MLDRPRRAGPRVPKPKVLLLVVLCASALVVGARPAAAHAVLVSSSPSDGAVLQESPDRVVLEFNEPVSADLGGLRVFDADGERVDQGAVETTDRSISVGVTADLPDGAYVASYRVTSADGHPVNGGLVFAVGDAEAEADVSGLLGDGEDRTWEVVGAVARFLAMAGALLVVGGAVFLARCHRVPEQRWPSVLLAAGAAVAVVGMVAVVPVQAALATGQGAGSVFQDGVASAVLADGFGAAVALGVPGVIVAAATARRWPAVALLASLAVLVSFPLVGHTRADDVVAGSTADIVHVGAAAVWTGGLVFLLAARSRTDDPAESASMVGRFSTLATVSIVFVGLAGVMLSLTEVRTLDGLTSTTYGQVLLAKVAVVAAVAAAGAYNHFRLVPAITTDPADPQTRRRLTRVLAGEVAGLIVAIAVTAALVNIPPAYVDTGVGQLHSEIVELGEDGSVQVVVDPNQAGQNSIHLYFYGPDGRPADIAEDVRIEMAKPGDDIGPITRTPFRAGPAHFQWDGPELVSPGRWELTVVARLDRFTEQSATAEVPVG